jgi:hypothetical protein
VGVGWGWGAAGWPVHGEAGSFARRASGGGARVRGGCSGVGVRAQGVGGSYLWGDGAT